jgi:peptide/nickel transport system permease protein
MRRLPLLLVVVALALAALLSSPDPHAIDLDARHAPISLVHPLGTDHLGRNLAARLLAGTWRTLAVVVVVVGLSASIGIALGLAASGLGGTAGQALLRLAELAIAMPSLVVALVVTGALGLTPLVAGVALALTGFGPYALLAFGLAETARGRPYVGAAWALGRGPLGVLGGHVLPAALPALRAYAGSDAARAVGAYAGLAFLGLGADSSAPDWGGMLFEYRIFLLEHPRLILAPAAAIAGLALALHLALDPRGPAANETSPVRRLLRLPTRAY